MKKSIIQFIEEKYAAFEDACNKEASPFLLLQLANANENAHTRILKYLLSIHHDKNKYYILDSFLDCFNLPKRASDNDPTISDQEVAIGNKGTGFIDLYIEYKDKAGQPIKVILENKIKGAGDTDKQLARYIATIARIEPEKFNEWYCSWTESQQTNANLSHIYVLYLTREGGSPAGESLPEKLKEALGNQYIECNYMDNLSVWFDNILPTLPIGVNHSISTGMHQYMLYLESLCNPMKNININLVSNLKKEYSDQEISDQEIYEGIEEYIKSLKVKNNQNATWIAYLEEECENIYALDFINKDGFADWRLHVTPSFIILYKKSWADLDTRKYVIPSLNLCLSMTNFKTNSSTIIWKLQVDHVQPDAKKRKKSEKMPDKLYFALKDALKKEGKGSNRGKTMLMEEITQTIEKSYFASSQKERQKMYEDLLDNSLNTLIETIDEVVKELSNPTTSKDN